jgi:CheY-like chemotaxis protein
METLARFIDRRQAVRPDDLSSVLAQRFAAEPDAMALAVVEAGRPLGLVARDVFTALQSQSPDVLNRITVAGLMDRQPLIVEAGAPVGDFIDDILLHQPNALGRGVIVVEHGVYAGLAGATALVAARRARKDEAREAAALIEELSVGIGKHLHSLINFAARLNRQALAPDAQVWAQAIAETSGELSDLTACARELHWAQSERMVLRPAPCRLRDLADMIDARWSGDLMSGVTGVMVSYDGDPTAAGLLDADRLVQCFDALIHRARMAARSHGGGAAVVEATLRARPTPRGLMLEGEVRDSVAGPPDETRCLAEDPTAELAVRLRMALAVRTLAAMGGRLTAEETAVGGGRIAFSIEISAAVVDAAPSPQPLAITGRAVRVLVVDDNATNRMVAESLCGLFGCVCESAVDGVEALKAASERPFDVILMDIRMPRMDGLEATRAIRRLPGAAGAVPILALTANADPADVQTYIAAGMQGAVEKPVKAEKLAEALDAALTTRAPAARAAG